MALLVVRNSHFLFAIDRTILVYDSSNKTSERTILPPVKIKPAVKSNDSSEDCSIEKLSKEIIDSNIQNIKLSDNQELLAITTRNKEVFLFNWLKDGQLELKFSTLVFRVSSAIRFSPDSDILLVTDKTGDCYSLDIINNSTLPKWILGHLSMVLDITFSVDGKYIISCDRDEKIRITKYPETYIIENYCLGHTEYVSSIELLPHSKDKIISVSGDTKMKLWSYMEGKELQDVSLPFPGYKIYVQHIDTNSSIVAIVLYNFDQLLIYKVTTEFKLIQNHKFNDHFISSVTFLSSKQLYITIIDENTGLISIVTLLSSDNYNEKHVEIELVDLVKDFKINTNSILTNDLALMFKKKFDNVKDYHEKKRKRIEAKV